jgi:pimeloyl-ACP methyl ester carboxylesterase
MIEANGVELCTEPFGDPADPPILLITGLGGSMLWWDEGFCRMLADGQRFVIRYDHRDTGRSVTYEPGRPDYTGTDLVADTAGVLDAYGIPAAHVVGVSAGGAFAQLLALDFADRVLSLVLISTSGALPEHGEALAAEIPDARLLTLDGAGHGVDRTDWETIVRAIVEHTAPTDRATGR